MRTRALLFVTLVAISFPALADKRIALVVGNAAYEHADRLSNPIVDSRAMRDVLRDRLGFQVIYGENLSKRDLERTIGRFATAARGADVAVTYYAGHGSTFGDTPYLVPIDAQYSSLDEMPYELVPLEQMIGELRRAKGIRIAIVDACRDNSAEQALKRTAMRGGEVTRGLAPPRNPDGLIVAYATQYLSTAADGRPGADSPFTAALLKNIATPGLDVKSLFYKVGAQVVAETDGKQRPEIKISLFEDYSLVQPTPVSQPAPPIAAPRPPAAPPADELAWSLIETTSDAKQIEAFLARFPQSALRSKAEARLSELKRTQTAALPPKAEPPPAPTILPTPALAPDEIEWKKIAESKNARRLRAFIKRFPSSRFREAAEDRLSSLQKPKHVAPTPKPVVKRTPKVIVAQPHKQAPTAARASGGGRCFVFNSERFCD